MPLCQCRFTSLSDLTDMKCWASVQSQGQRILCNLSRRWYMHKSRVRCAASTEEDGGRQRKIYSQEVHLVDHYKVLGLRRQATASAIKLAYRQLARQVQITKSSYCVEHMSISDRLCFSELFVDCQHDYVTARPLYNLALSSSLYADQPMIYVTFSFDI